MPISQQTQWLICRILAVVLFILALTPMVIPANVYKPTLLGTPFTLWMGFTFSILFLLLTLWGIRVYPKESNQL